jgi:hypothetical protein
LDPTRALYVDTLDGRASNRYFYRTANVDGAHNQSPLGVATPPVTLPSTAAPQGPTVLGAAGGDGSVTISFTAVADPTVTTYRVYRAATVADAGDIRNMTVVATVTDGRPPAGRVAPLVASDATVVPYQTYFYRVTAVLAGGGDSPPSSAVSARSFDGRPPPEPIWQRSEWVKLDSTGVEHEFAETDPTLIPVLAVQLSFASQTFARILIQNVNAGRARPAGPWLSPATAVGATTAFKTYLRGLSPAFAQSLQSRAVALGGLEALSAVRSVAAP